MIIHKIRGGESLMTLSSEYAVSLPKLMADNGLQRDNLCEGEEILVLKPTKEVLIREADTLTKLALHYGVKKNTLLTNNPALMGEELLRPGQMLTIKYQTPPLGPASALGLVYGDCLKESFIRALPYLTYAVFFEFELSELTLSRCATLTSLARLARSKGRQTLLGINLSESGWLDNELCRALLLENMVELAREGGYAGLYLKYAATAENRDAFGEFVLKARRALIGRNLTLFTDASQSAPEISDLSDAAVLSFGDAPRSYPEVSEAISRFSQTAESSKVFINVPTLGELDGRLYDKTSLIQLARHGAKRVTKDENTLLCSIPLQRQRGSVQQSAYASIPSLDMAYRIMKKGCECGYMGYAFDVATTPIEYLCLFNSQFARADYNIASSDE